MSAGVTHGEMYFFTHRQASQLALCASCLDQTSSQIQSNRMAIVIEKPEQSSTTSTEQQWTLALTNTSISSEKPSRETRSARSCLTHSCNTSRDHIHHETTDRKVARRSSRSETCRRRPPTRTCPTCDLQTHSSHRRFTEAHDHHAGRPHHSYDGARPATSPYPKVKSSPIRHQSTEEATRWQFKEWTSISYRQKTKLNTSVTSSPSKKTLCKSSLNTASNAWAAFTSHRQELTSPKYPQRETHSNSSIPQ